MLLIQHIRGDTFLYDVNITGAGDITSVRSQIRNSRDVLIAEAVVTGSGTAYTIMVDDTTDWLGRLYMDIEFTCGTVIISTDKIMINVEKDVTH